MNESTGPEYWIGKTPEECIDEIAEAVDLGILSPDLRSRDTLQVMTEAGWRIVKFTDELFDVETADGTILEEWEA